ncbi:MAG: DUF1311 domain-containing protein [Deltaproteobacteria bacterium]|nr:DUF1311 domain-containing protein [Deltaproteobacteria bacterium]
MRRGLEKRLIHGCREGKLVLKNKAFIFFFLLILSWHPSFTRADQEPTGSLCHETASTVEMLDCLSQRLAEAEALMMDRFNRLMKCLNSAQQETLRQGQNVWLRFRALNAEFEASTEEGGSLYAVERLAGLVEMTRRRSDELDRFYTKFSDSDVK